MRASVFLFFFWMAFEVFRVPSRLASFSYFLFLPVFVTRRFLIGDSTSLIDESTDCFAGDWCSSCFFTAFLSGDFYYSGFFLGEADFLAFSGDCCFGFLTGVCCPYVSFLAVAYFPGDSKDSSRFGGCKCIGFIEGVFAFLALRTSVTFFGERFLIEFGAHFRFESTCTCSSNSTFFEVDSKHYRAFL